MRKENVRCIMRIQWIFSFHFGTEVEAMLDLEPVFTGVSSWIFEGKWFPARRKAAGILGGLQGLTTQRGAIPPGKTTAHACEYRFLEGTRPFFKCVQPLTGHRLRVETGAGNLIVFDFTPRLSTTWYADLRDEALFHSVTTDGEELTFCLPGKMSVRVSSMELLHMLAYNKTRYTDAAGR